MTQIRRTIHIIDDDEPVRRSLECLLSSQGFSTCSYPSAPAFVDSLARVVDGCVLLDVRMPEFDGLQLQAWLNERKFRLPVIVMTAYGEIKIAVRAMKAGAVDFIEKPFDSDYLLSAIEFAFDYARPAACNIEASKAVRRLAALSPRERQVLNLYMAGKYTKLVAHELGLSVRTVEVHRARMLHRLGVRQLGEAIRIAVMAQVAELAKGH